MCHSWLTDWLDLIQSTIDTFIFVDIHSIWTWFDWIIYWSTIWKWCIYIIVGPVRYYCDSFVTIEIALTGSSSLLVFFSALSISS